MLVLSLLELSLKLVNLLVLPFLFGSKYLVLYFLDLKL